MTSQFYDAGYNDALEKLGAPKFLTNLISRFRRAPAPSQSMLRSAPGISNAVKPTAGLKPMQEFSMEHVPQGRSPLATRPTAPSEIDKFRANMQSSSGAPQPSASAQLASQAPSYGRHGLESAKDLAAAPAVAPPDLRMAPGSAAAVANKVPLPKPPPVEGAAGAAAAESPGLLSGLGTKGKIGLGVGAAALLGGGLLYKRHQAQKAQENAAAQQFYGPPQQMQAYGY